METLAACYKADGIDGVYQFIQDRIYETYDRFDELSEEQNEEGVFKEEITEEEEINEEDKINEEEEINGEDETNEDIEVVIPEWLIEMEEFLDKNYQSFVNYPETIMNALYHSPLLKYPEINEWFEALKSESKDKPIELLWNFPMEFKSYRIRNGHDDFVKGLVYIGEHRFATSSEDGYLKTWTYQPSKWKNFQLYPEDEIKAHDGYPVNNLAYHPGNRWIASCGDDNSVRLWDSETLEMIAEFKGHTDYVSNVVFVDDLLFSASKDTRIGVWDINTLQNITFLEGHTDWINTMTVSPDKKGLFSVSANNQLIEWDIVQLVLKHQLNEGGKNAYLDIPGENIFITLENNNCLGHSSRPKCAVWASDNKLYTSYNEVIVWDCKNWNILQTFAYDVDTINCFIIKDSFLITFSRLIKIYHLETGELIKEYRNPESREFEQAVLSGDEQFIISTDRDGNITAWDCNELLQGEYSYGIGADMHTFEVFYEDEGDNLGVAVSGGFVTDAGVWDLKTGRLARKLERPKDTMSGEARITKLHNHSSQVLIMYEKVTDMLSPYNQQDKKLLELPSGLFHPEIAVGTKNGIIFGTQSYQPYYINLNNHEVSVFDKKFAYTNEFSISPDQRYTLALTYPQSFGPDGTPFDNPWLPISSPLVLIDLEKEEQIGTFWYPSLLSRIKLNRKWDKLQDKIKILKTTYPCASAWSGDSKFFAAGFNHGKIIIWNIDTKKRLKKIKLPDKDYVSYLAWQEDGLLTAMLNNTDKIVQIDPKSGKILKFEKIQGKSIFFRASHKKGRYIIWSSNNKAVGIFDALKFEIVCVITTEVKARSVRIEKNRLLIGGEDGFLYGYNIEGIL